MSAASTRAEGQVPACGRANAPGGPTPPKLTTNDSCKARTWVASLASKIGGVTAACAPAVLAALRRHGNADRGGSGGGRDSPAGGLFGDWGRRRRLILLSAALATAGVAIVLIAVLVPVLRAQQHRSVSAERYGGVLPPPQGSGANRTGAELRPSAGSSGASGLPGAAAPRTAPRAKTAPPHPHRRPTGNVSQAFTHITSDLQLERDCRRVVLVGFNAYDLASMALVTPDAFRTLGGRTGREAMSEAFRAASHRGLNVVRTWAHSSDPEFPFQVAPGLYLEAALVGLDWVVANAGAAGLQLVLSLVDNWKYYNGMDQYVDWSPTAPPRTRPRPPDMPGDPAGVARPRTAPSPPADGREPQVVRRGGAGDGSDPYEAARHSLFFSDPGARQLYRSHVATILNRRNTFTGRLYRDEPAILAWDLANEPRCEVWANADCNRILQDWVLEMSAYARQLDPNHLITLGSEGFFGPQTPDLQRHNPGQWAAGLGQDFVANNAAPHIDFATVHVWPDNWDSGSTYAEFLPRWLSSHLTAAATILHKPVLLEEFGKKVLVVTPDVTEPPPVGPNASARTADPRDTAKARVAQPRTGAAAGGASAAAVRDAAALASRDEVYRVTYAEVLKAVPKAVSGGAGRAAAAPPASPLLGSLFWSWQLQIFADAAPDPYGVMLGDRALDLAAAHAAAVANLTGGRQAPRRRGCACSCWVPVMLQQPAGLSAASATGAAAAGGVVDAATDTATLQPGCSSVWEACGLVWHPGTLLDGWEALEETLSAAGAAEVPDLDAPATGAFPASTDSGDGTDECMDALLRPLAQLPALLQTLLAARPHVGAASDSVSGDVAAAKPLERTQVERPADTQPSRDGGAPTAIAGEELATALGAGSLADAMQQCGAVLWRHSGGSDGFEGRPAGGNMAAAGAATAANRSANSPPAGGLAPAARRNSSAAVAASCAVLWAEELCSRSSVRVLFARQGLREGGLDGTSSALLTQAWNVTAMTTRTGTSAGDLGGTLAGADAWSRGQAPPDALLAASVQARVQPPRLLRVYGSEAECCAVAGDGGAFLAGCA